MKIISTLRPFRSLFSLLIGGTALLATSTAAFAGKTSEEIDASVNVALKRFHTSVAGSEEVIKKAKGVLIMPEVTKAGFVVGGEFGRGVLQIEGKTVSYYSLASASVGLQAGVQSKDIVVAFMTEESLKKFQAVKKGWDIGVDGAVVILDLGAGNSVSTKQLNQPVIGFVFGQKGLMADISLKGAKIKKFVPKDQ